MNKDEQAELDRRNRNHIPGTPQVTNFDNFKKKDEKNEAKPKVAEKTTSQEQQEQ